MTRPWALAAPRDRGGRGLDAFVREIIDVAHEGFTSLVVHHLDDQVVPVGYSAELLKVLKAGGFPTSSESNYDPGSSGHSVDSSIIPKVWSWLAGFSL